MHWKVATVVVFTLLYSVNARPGIRNPPTRFLSENENDRVERGPFTTPSTTTPSTTTQSPVTNVAGEFPLVTNRRYLEQHIDLSPSRPFRQNLEPINIFSEYTTSSNFIVNEFLRKNIQVLLSDRLPRRQALVSKNENNALARNGDFEEKSYPETGLKYKKVFVKNKPQIHKVVTNWQDKYSYEVEDFNQSTEDINAAFPVHVGPLSEEAGGSKIHVNDPMPLVIITTRPVFKPNSGVNDKLAYYGNEPTKVSSTSHTIKDSSHHHYSQNPTPSSQTSKYHNYYPTTVDKFERPASTYPYDPADPDPFYDSVEDLSQSSQADASDGYVTPGSNVKSEIPSKNKLNGQCPGVKVTLNNKVSLNFQSDTAQCDDLKLNFNNGNEATTAQNEPAEVVSKKKTPAATGASQAVLHSAPTQLIPLIAQIPAAAGGGTHGATQAASGIIPQFISLPGGGAAGAGHGGHGGGHGGHGGGHGGHKKKHKKPLNEIGIITGLKYLAILFTKFFAVFTIANPFTFSFWVMMFSPLAVLLAGGAGLAMVIYPFASALLTTAYKSPKRSPSTVVIHRHNYIPGWRGPKRHKHRPVRPRPWGHRTPWRRIGPAGPQNIRNAPATVIPLRQAHLDELDTFVKKSIANFRTIKES